MVSIEVPKTQLSLQVLTNRLPLTNRIPLTNRNRNRNLQTSKAPFESQAQSTSLFTSAAYNQRGCPKDSIWEAQVRLPKSTSISNRLSLTNRLFLTNRLPCPPGSQGHEALATSCFSASAYKGGASPLPRHRILAPTAYPI